MNCFQKDAIPFNLKSNTGIILNHINIYEMKKGKRKKINKENPTKRNHNKLQ